MEILRTFNYVFAVVLFAMGLFPVLQSFHVLDMNPLGFLQGTAKSLVLLVCALYLSIDGFGEEHLMKYLSLLTSILIGLMVLIPFLTQSGIISVHLPNVLFLIEPYLHLVAGIFLIIGAYIHH